MSTGDAGVGAQDARLRVNGAPEGGWRTAHAAGHPELGGGNSYDDDCPHCRLDARLREGDVARASLDGALAKVDKQRAFLDAAEASARQYKAELQEALERIEDARQEVSRDGMVG